MQDALVNSVVVVAVKKYLFTWRKWNFRYDMRDTFGVTAFVYVIVIIAQAQPSSQVGRDTVAENIIRKSKTHDVFSGKMPKK